MSAETKLLDRVNVLQALNDDLAAISGQARQSLVQIASGTGRGQGTGAGTIWHPDGLIVTNAHVVERGGVQVALPDGRVLPARILAADAELDLAALRVEASDLPTIALGSGKAPHPGEWVVAIGHPWGVPGASTAGIVIGSGTEFPELPTGRRAWIAVSLHMRPGHSGGPLLDADGHLVGINTMISGPDVGFAIPVQVVRRFLRDALGQAEAGGGPARNSII